MVPRSGCLKMRYPGTAVKAKAQPNRFQSNRSEGRTARNPASTTTRATLANSEGWNWNDHRGIHREAPWMGGKNSTATNTATVTP